jgi:hypothetical protein
MPREVARWPGAPPAISMIALALGAAAFGAVAVGVLAIGRLAVGRVAIKKARFEALEVDELTVRRLRVLDYDGSAAPRLSRRAGHRAQGRLPAVRRTAEAPYVAMLNEKLRSR